MASGCKPCAKKRQQWKVQLPGGVKITKTSEAAARAFASKHPGATVIPPGG